MNGLKIHAGFSIVELMVGTAIGLVVSYSIMEIYLLQSQLYKTTSSQQLIQNSQNAIVNLVTPIIRSSGFIGCGSIYTAVSNLNAGGPPPVSILNTNPSMIMGYDGGTVGINIAQINANNDTSAADWTPALDASLVGNAEKGSDVLVVLGSQPGTYPLAVTTIDTGSTQLTLQPSTLTISSGQLAAVSDCIKSVVFKVTGVAGTQISHAAGGSALQNATSAFTVSFQPGAQFVQLQQTAFFVGQSQGGQSALMRATLNGTTWSVQPIVTGVDIMKVQYGIGTGAVITQYVPASAVTNWSQVYSVRIGFLLQGQPSSASNNTTQFTVLDTPVTVPADNILRHTFEITVNLRNAIQ